MILGGAGLAMHLYAKLKPGPKFRPMRAAFYYSQRLATVPFIRTSASRIIASAINILNGRRDMGATSEIPPKDFSQALSMLRNDGFAKLDGFVPEPLIKSIVSYFSDKEVISAGGRYGSVGLLPAGTPMASYPLDCVLGCPGVIDLLNDPDLIRLATQYLGCPPTISSLGVRWSLPGYTGIVDTQCFHRDYDDWRFSKLFVYLTDVDAESGPHILSQNPTRPPGACAPCHTRLI
jgi:hypothetical protein